MELTNKQPPGTPDAEFSPSSRLPGWLWMSLLVIATLLAYQPAWHGQPVWDDAAHLTPPVRRSLTGLLHTWTMPGITQQYYPVVHSAFWVEHRLWGDSTLGYHLVNILLHVTAALLLFKVLNALQIPAAGLAAAIFALHPVQAESVAWMSELKNTLSAVCYFGAALAYLRFDRTRSRAAYAGSLALFVVGLLAKSVIATLPAALLVVFWWQRGKLDWKRDVSRLTPFFAIGMAAGLFTSWVERRFNGAEGAAFNYSIVERCLIAGRDIWFYLGNLFWPSDLMFSYPRWNISQAVWRQYLFPAAAALLVAALWFLRRWRRGPLAALLFFIGTLFPALGFFNVFPFKYSFVADHFQYLACAGPIVIASVGIHAIFTGTPRLRGVACYTICCALLLTTLAVLTWRQSRIYTDMETLWRTTIDRNPDSWLAQDDLGAMLYERGQTDEAIIHFRAALAIEPADAEAQNNLGAALEKKGQLDEAVIQFRRAVDIRPGFAEAHRNLGEVLLRKGHASEAILECQKAAAMRPDLPQVHFTLADALLQSGQTAAAAVEFQRTLELSPDDEQAHYNLGIALRQEGHKDEALLEFRRAVALRPEFTEAQNNLGNILLQQGRVDEAITHLQTALQTHPDYPQAHYNLGRALLKKGQVEQAIVEFQTLLTLDPASTEARRNLANIAWHLATSPVASSRNGIKAVGLARQLDQLAGGSNPATTATMAAAYAETGDLKEAVATARRALELATRQNNTAQAAAIQSQLTCYEVGKPFRDTSAAP